MERDDQIISRFEHEPGAVHRIAEDREIERLTQQGYTLVAVLYTDTLTQAHDTESVPVSDPHNSYTVRTDVTSRTRHYVVREAKFLMRLHAEDALSQKSAELEAAQDAVATAKQALRAAEERCSALDKEKQKAETERTTSHGNYMRSIKDREVDVATKRRLEGDIAKIRRAIGDKQMKEILEDPAT